MENNKVKFDFTQKICGKDCTEAFFDNSISSFSNDYSLIKIPKKEKQCECLSENVNYCIVKKNTLKCIMAMHNIQKLSPYAFLIEYEENMEYGILLTMRDIPIMLSEKFMRVEDIFEHFVLVLTFDGERKLICTSHHEKDLVFCDWHSELSCGGNSNHAIMKRLNGERVILLKKDLVCSTTSFKHVEGQGISKAFRIVSFGNGEKAVIRISDLKVSEHYKNIKTFGNCEQRKDYVFVNKEGKKGTAIMRVEDFDVSDFYAVATHFGDNYVIVKETCDSPEVVLRLSDFAVAEFK